MKHRTKFWSSAQSQSQSKNIVEVEVEEICKQQDPQSNPVNSRISSKKIWNVDPIFPGRWSSSGSSSSSSNNGKGSSSNSGKGSSSGREYLNL